MEKDTKTKKKNNVKKVVKKEVKKEVKNEVKKEVAETSKVATKKNPPLRNYFIVIVVSILVIILTLYGRTFYLNYENYKINHSVFVENKINAISIDDLTYTVSEITEAVLFVSYTGSEDIYNMESKLYKEIEKSGLTEKVIYLNVSDYKGSSSYLTLLRNAFPNVKNEINSVPMFIYIKDGKAIEAMSSELKMVDYKLFNKLVKKYEIE